MSAGSGPALTPTGTISTSADRRRVVLATVIGTTIEWYDFFTYAAATAVVFIPLFFSPFGEGTGGLLAFFGIGVSFLFRPLGAFLAGHYGDKLGRRRVLMWTLVMMGLSTALIGVLPTAAVAGFAAPILLLLLRVLQGISAGGEWGGAVLMAVEHAPKDKRGLFGASPQVGVPLGLLLSSGIMALTSSLLGADAFAAWGWRIPFLLSIVLIFVGYWIRRGVEESPVFLEIAQRAAHTKMPIARLLRHHLPLVLLAALVFAGNNAVGYMTTGGFVQNYTTDPKGPLALPVTPILWIVALSAVTWLIFTWLAGWICDKIGRRTTYLIGWVLQAIGVIALFPMVNTGSLVMVALALILLTLGLGFTYGPQAAFYTEMFPASIRFSGVSISYALGSILGGAFSGLIAKAIVQATGSTVGVVWYLLGMTVIGLLATLALKDRSGIPLGPDAEDEQSVSAVYGLSKA
ncbi:MFS transporter [Microbacterium gorillae]|uniref:MFS transporter n=1 Tax=Microbacterium gorillae TaxID=1231063 RepID=UPI00058B316B|nr:MFS transporter [Microbacterium gorillae]